MMKHPVEQYYDALAWALKSLGTNGVTTLPRLLERTLAEHLPHDYRCLEEHLCKEPLEAQAWDTLSRLSIEAKARAQMDSKEEEEFRQWLHPFLAGDPMGDALPIRILLVNTGSGAGCVAALKARVRCTRLERSRPLGGLAIPLTTNQGQTDYLNQLRESRLVHSRAFRQLSKTLKDQLGSDVLGSEDYTVFWTIDYRGPIIDASWGLALACAEFFEIARSIRSAPVGLELSVHPCMYVTGLVAEDGLVAKVDGIEAKLQAVLDAEGVATTHDLEAKRCLVIAPADSFDAHVRARFPWVGPASSAGVQIVYRCEEAFIKAFRKQGMVTGSTIEMADILVGELRGKPTDGLVARIRQGDPSAGPQLVSTIVDHLSRNYPRRNWGNGPAISPDPGQDLHEFIWRLTLCSLFGFRERAELLPLEVVAAAPQLAGPVVSAINGITQEILDRDRYSTPDIMYAHRLGVGLALDWVKGVPDEAVGQLAVFCLTALLYAALCRGVRVSELLGMATAPPDA